MDRPISFEEAKNRYVHRFTMDHCPQWARTTLGTLDTYPAPQYASDWEWYCRTTFPGEGGLSKRNRHCQSDNQSWPLGQRLDKPFRVLDHART